MVLQLGGSTPEQLRDATEIAAPYHYDAINLNCGCPSERVSGVLCAMADEHWLKDIVVQPLMPQLPCQILPPDRR